MKQKMETLLLYFVQHKQIEVSNVYLSLKQTPLELDLNREHIWN